MGLSQFALEQLIMPFQVTGFQSEVAQARVRIIPHPYNLKNMLNNQTGLVVGNLKRVELDEAADCRTAAGRLQVVACLEVLAIARKAGRHWELAGYTIDRQRD